LYRVISRHSKKEEVNDARYRDYKLAQLALFQYIEGWYNRKKIHRNIGLPNPTGNGKYRFKSSIVFETIIYCTALHGVAGIIACTAKPVY